MIDNAVGVIDEITYPLKVRFVRIQNHECTLATVLNNRSSVNKILCSSFLSQNSRGAYVRRNSHVSFSFIDFVVRYFDLCSFSFFSVRFVTRESIVSSFSNGETYNLLVLQRVWYRLIVEISLEFELDIGR